MRWLITVHADADLDGLAGTLAAAEAALGPEDAVPLGVDELVLFAEGPADLPRRLDREHEVLRVSPDSEPSPY